MADEHQLPGSTADDNHDDQQLLRTPPHGRRMLGLDTFMDGFAELRRSVTAQTDHTHGHDTATRGGADRVSDGVANANLVPYYESSPESTVAQIDHTESNNFEAHGDANRHPDRAAHVSTGQCQESPIVVPGTSPRLRLRSEDELTDYSDDDYQYEQTSSDSDSECQFVEERSMRRSKGRSKSARPVARHPDAPQISKLQEKRQQFAAKGIELDKNGTRRGVVRGAPDNLEFFDHHEWKPAVYHFKIREKLLRVTDGKGKYDEEPVSGVDPLDRTAFKSDQKSWRFDSRDHRPEILFQWNQTEDTPSELPGFWYDQGRMILSVENRPMRKWPELPVTLSGQCEGMRLEAFKRTNPNISMNELKARMPRETCKRGGLAVRTIQTPALANRMARDRCRIGAKAWVARQGSSEIERRMLQTIPEDIQRQIIRTNSTRCWRDLTQEELEYVEAANKGVAENFARAGTRRLDEETRRQREEQKARRTMGKKGEGLKTHPVVEEALQQQPALVPRTMPGNRYHVSIAPPSPPIKVESDDHENCGFSLSDFAVEANDTVNQKRPISPAADAPLKRLKFSTDFADDNSGNREHSENLVSGGDKLSSTSGASAGADFRYKKPSTALDMFIVQGALSLSRDDYERYVGVPPGYTSRAEPYAYQLSELQAALAQEFDSEDAVPQLKSWGPVRSFHDFQALVVDRRKSSGGAAKANELSNDPEKGPRDMGLEGDTLVE
ncbi:MAG: hypothetical protein LQ338_004026 [Usnochroma carphineum]|nr:MAG: hypothetical protein LQ338_004026 [Usnochroma carphineum]